MPSKLPSPHCEIFVGTIGGETTSRVAPDAMAYSSRDANYVMNVHGSLGDGGRGRELHRWAREFFAKSRPFSSGGAYINFLTEEETDRDRHGLRACLQSTGGAEEEIRSDKFLPDESEHQAGLTNGC